MRISTLPWEDFLVLDEGEREALMKQHNFATMSRTKRQRPDALFKDEHMAIYKNMA